jgi:hypothetical protein
MNYPVVKMSGMCISYSLFSGIISYQYLDKAQAQDPNGGVHGHNKSSRVDIPTEEKVDHSDPAIDMYPRPMLSEESQKFMAMVETLEAQIASYYTEAGPLRKMKDEEMQGTFYRPDANGEYQDDPKRKWWMEMSESDMPSEGYDYHIAKLHAEDDIFDNIIPIEQPPYLTKSLDPHQLEGVAQFYARAKKHGM